jgi:DNA replication and repair protein RecF
MWLKKINLFNFRNFKEKTFIFNPFLTIVIGENAKGKTNLLEAVYCLITGKGFREHKENELIFFGEKKAKIEGFFEDKDHKFKYEIIMEIHGKEVKKTYLIDYSKKNLNQFKKEITKTVLFSPDQLSIITGSPEERRNYFDRFLSENDNQYKKKLNNYQNALRKRNKLLESYEKINNDFLEELSFWNSYLIEQSNYIFEKRHNYCRFLNKHFSLDKKHFFIDYHPSLINKEKFKEVFNEELKYRRTLIGPQKDNFFIFLKNTNEKNIHLFGSRSEQRLALFWLKMNEINYYEEKLKIRPILLLDDIFSELDFNNRSLILKLIKKYQSILTTTEIDVIKIEEGVRSLIKI